MVVVKEEITGVEVRCGSEEGMGRARFGGGRELRDGSGRKKCG